MGSQGIFSLTPKWGPNVPSSEPTMHGADKEKGETGQRSAEHTKEGLDSCWCFYFFLFFIFIFARGKEKDEGQEDRMYLARKSLEM